MGQRDGRDWIDGRDWREKREKHLNLRHYRSPPPPHTKKDRLLSTGSFLTTNSQSWVEGGSAVKKLLDHLSKRILR